LLRDGVLVNECRTPEGITPMLHSETTLMAYNSAECVSAVHGGAVTRGDECIIMPASTGSGKSTLTAALLANGYGYSTDDVALLEGEPMRVRGIPTCIGLKTGSWKVLGRAFPEIERLPVHLRADGQEVRYLRPPASALASSQEPFRVRAIVFPSYARGADAHLKPIGAAEALTRLTQAGYDLPGRLDDEVVDRLVVWISAIPCFELGYGSLTEAITQISTVMP
jgi:hypothetical protein